MFVRTYHIILIQHTLHKKCKQKRSQTKLRKVFRSIKFFEFKKKLLTVREFYLRNNILFWHIEKYGLLVRSSGVALKKVFRQSYWFEKAIKNMLYISHIYGRLLKKISNTLFFKARKKKNENK